MYLKNIFIENQGPLEQISILEDYLFKENGDPKTLVFVGKNGSGKTILLSSIVDALHQFANDAFSDILPQEGTTYKYYKVSGGPGQRVGSSYSFSFLNFASGANGYEYLDKSGNLSYDLLKKKTNNTITINNNYNDSANKKIFSPTKDKQDFINDFTNNTYCYFPVNRYEFPYWLNEWQKEKINTKNIYNGQLGKPLVIENGLDDNKSWILDLFLDARAGLEQDETGLRTTENANIKLSLSKGIENIERILSKILQKEVKLQLNFRNAGSNRLQIVDKTSKTVIVPSLDHLSGGQAILLNLFTSIIKLSDQGDLNKSIQLNIVEGIVIIDEIDLSLHIDLQKNILPELLSLFPKVQFIVTTHSPFFLLGLEEKAKNSDFEYQIINLPNGELDNDIKGIEEVKTAYTIFEENFADYKLEFDRIQQKLTETSSLSGPLVMTEGKTDRKHLKKALEKLKSLGEYEHLNIKFLEYEDTMGDTILYNYCIAESKKQHEYPIFCIFDRDNSKMIGNVEENGTIKNRGNNLYSFCIPKPPTRIFNEICIEHYYTDDEIKTTDGQGRRLFIGSDFVEKHNTFYDSEGNWTKEKNNAGKNTIIENCVYGSTDNIGTTNIALPKADFAENIMNEVDGFNSFNIDNFRLILNLLDTTINPQNALSGAEEILESSEENLN